MSGEERNYARVQCLLEVDLTQPWGGEASLKEVRETALREVGEVIGRLRESHGLGARVRIVGTPLVHAMLVSEGPGAPVPAPPPEPEGGRLTGHAHPAWATHAMFMTFRTNEMAAAVTIMREHADKNAPDRGYRLHTSGDDRSGGWVEWFHPAEPPR